MKKLIAIALLFVLLLPAVSFADDPIVGHWYMLYDKEVSPEFASTFENNDFIIMVLSVLNDGTIFNCEFDVVDKTATPFTNAAGKWEKTGSNYTYSIIAIGSGDAIIEDDCLLLQLNNSNIYLRLRKLEPLDLYKDYVVK